VTRISRQELPYNTLFRLLCRITGKPRCAFHTSDHN